MKGKRQGKNYKLKCNLQDVLYTLKQPVQCIKASEAGKIMTFNNMGSMKLTGFGTRIGNLYFLKFAETNTDKT